MNKQLVEQLIATVELKDFKYNFQTDGNKNVRRMLMETEHLCKQM